MKKYLGILLGVLAAVAALATNTISTRAADGKQGAQKTAGRSDGQAKKTQKGGAERRNIRSANATTKIVNLKPTPGMISFDAACEIWHG